MVVVACNTATAAAITHLRATFDIPIVGLEPAVKPACAMTRTGVVAVIATERSLQGEKFLSTLARYGQGVEVLKIVGRGFVEGVENNAEQDLCCIGLLYDLFQGIHTDMGKGNGYDVTHGLHINQHKNHQVIENVLAYLETCYSNSSLCLDMVADHLGVSYYFLSRIFKEETNKSFSDMLNDIRIRHAMDLLSETQNAAQSIAQS